MSVWESFWEILLTFWDTLPPTIHYNNRLSLSLWHHKTDVTAGKNCFIHRQHYICILRNNWVEATGRFPALTLLKNCELSTNRVFFVKSVGIHQVSFHSFKKFKTLHKCFLCLNVAWMLSLKLCLIQSLTVTLPELQ